MDETVYSVVNVASQPMCCAISPTANILATGLVDGSLHLYNFSHTRGGSGAPNSISHALAYSPKVHEEDMSCRAVIFSIDGALLYSGSADKSICVCDVATGKEVYRMDDAHNHDLSALGIMAGDKLLASGDENGMFRLWDIRSREKVYQYKKHSDFISCIVEHTREHCAVVSSGDGTLSVHDMRTRKIRCRSEENDDELLSVAVMKAGKKLVAGTQSGVVNMYSWGAMNDCSDRFPGHPESVDTIVKYDESTILTGSSDGGIRILSVFPNKLLGILGSHDNFPVERMAMSHERTVLASTSHDNTVRLWDLSIMEDDEDDGVADADAASDDDQEELVLPTAGASASDDGEDGKDGEEDISGSLDEDEDDLDSVDGDDSDEDEDLDEDEELDEDEDGPITTEIKPTWPALKLGKSKASKKSDAGPSSAQLSTKAADGDDGDEEDKEDTAKGGDEDDAEADGGDGGSGDEEDESDSDDEGSKKKKRKREKTKWRKGSDVQKAKKTQTGNFFKDML